MLMLLTLCNVLMLSNAVYLNSQVLMQWCISQHCHWYLIWQSWTMQSHLLGLSHSSATFGCGFGKFLLFVNAQCIRVFGTM